MNRNNTKPSGIIKVTVCQHEEDFFGCGIRGELTCGNIQAGNHIGAAIRSQAAQGAGNKINVVLVSNGLLLYNGSSVIDIGKLDHREVEGNALFLQFGDHVVDGVSGSVDARGCHTVLYSCAADPIDEAIVMLMVRITGIVDFTALPSFHGAIYHRAGKVKQDDQLQRLCCRGFQRGHAQGDVVGAIFIGGCALGHGEVAIVDGLLHLAFCFAGLIRQHVQRQ